MWSEFKEFISRGNVLDLAIAVIIGASFSKIVDSLVQDVIMPVFGIVVGGINLEKLELRIGGVVVSYGKFIQAMVDFLLIAFAIFMIIKVTNRFYRGKNDKRPYKVKPTTNIELLTEIRDILKRKEKISNSNNSGEAEPKTVIRFKRK